MLAEGIISPVTGLTDRVNSIVCNIKETPSGKKVRLCLDSKDINKNIKREHYYSKNHRRDSTPAAQQEVFLCDGHQKGYWHVELDEESSLL